jgi:hypothetical protein
MVPRCSTTWRAVKSRVIPANRGLAKYRWVSSTSCPNWVGVSASMMDMAAPCRTLSARCAVPGFI